MSDRPAPAVATLTGRDGNRLVADLQGPDDGPAVLLLHGGGQTRHSWRSTLTTLAERGWRAAAVDLRGHGESEWAEDGDYSLDAFAGDAAALAAGFDRPALVGASLGGLSAMVALSDHGMDIGSALVLVDVAHRLEEAGRERIAAFMTDHQDGFATLDEAADAVAAYNPHRPRPSDLSGLRKNLRRREDGRWVWHWDPAFISGRGGSPDETRSSIVDEDRLHKAARSLEIPTLLVRGRRSDLLSEGAAEEFLGLVPEARFADVAGAGHMVAGDRNDIFNRAILDFLAESRGGAQGP